jgi:hypothetical protein
VGGAGVASTITGSSVTRAGGGGGGGEPSTNTVRGLGGAGGGGAGGTSGNPGTAGTVNTGSGGGGGSSSQNGGNGGSGVVIFALPVQAITTFSAGVTQTSAVVGVNRVYTVTATSTDSETVTIS